MYLFDNKEGTTTHPLTKRQSLQTRFPRYLSTYISNFSILLSLYLTLCLRGHPTSRGKILCRLHRSQYTKAEISAITLDKGTVAYTKVAYAPLMSAIALVYCISEQSKLHCPIGWCVMNVNYCTFAKRNTRCKGQAMFRYDIKLLYSRVCRNCSMHEDSLQ